LSDAPYEQTDHLFGLQLRGLTLAAAGRNGTFIGGVLAGGDRLQFHRWVLEGLYQAGLNQPGYGGSIAYANRQLAPLTIIASALALRYHDVAAGTTGTIVPADYTLDKQLYEANLSVSRAFYGNPVSLGFTLIDDNQPGDLTLLYQQRKAAGPFLSASYNGIEATPYTGPRRAFVLSSALALYPQAWSTAQTTFLDAGAEIVGVTPLPLSRRHTLTLDLRGRDLFNLPPGARWLQVGGGLSALALSRRPNLGVPPEVEIPSLPDQITFFEPLLGYEDYPIATDRIAIAEVVYTYPFIIDWGTASTLALLPALFVRQIDLQLFAAAATPGRSDVVTGRLDLHAAVGGALSLRTALWVVPLSLTYQIARRLEDDQALVQLLLLTAN